MFDFLLLRHCLVVSLSKKKKNLPFFLKIAQILSTVSCKGVSYKTLLSVPLAE